jgi:hypothetical protein
MHGEAPGTSAEAAVRRAPRSLLVRIRRFLGFGFMRASVPLRTVVRSGEPIRARARLESAQIKERYYYHQQISRNPCSEPRKEPEGEIKLILPYDGEEYFTRQAYRDVERARHYGADRERGALVGFLTLTNYENTDLDSRLNLDEEHGSVPIAVRLPAAPGPREPDPLLADNSSCVVSHDYRPVRHPGLIIPVHLDIDLYDPDTAGIGYLPTFVDEGLDIRIMQQVEFTPDLSLRMMVYLYLPRELADGAHATVSEVFIGWRTRTSLRSLKLNVSGARHQLRYNPERGGGGLEWRDVPMNAEPEPDGGDIRVFRSKPMLLSIPKPGDLYRQDTLDGTVEVTVDRLLSGTDARLFDATGKLCRPPGPELESIISTEFSLTLDDAFARRVRSPYQQMHFDEVIPGAARIEDIVTALRNRGFTVTPLLPRDGTEAGSQPNASLDDWWLSARRVHGPDTLAMLLYVTGKRHRTRRERKLHGGGMAYNTTMDSGELQLYVCGFLPGGSKTAIQEMNALRRALRERFSRLPAGR